MTGRCRHRHQRDHPEPLPAQTQREHRAGPPPESGPLAHL